MLVDLLAGCAVLGRLIAPGAFMARRFQLTQPLLAGFLLGSALLVAVILALQLAGPPFTLSSFVVA